ncbi:MAG: NYN domain-containing protein [Gammaproteobacteria bacterium]|jgi:uncharacterized LabA/DUF88 family protein|nr:NYN domain-containing protein [Gammaproteobacteria bacterium]
MSADQFRNGQTVALLVDFGAFNAALSNADLPSRYSTILASVAAGRRLRRATAYAVLDSQTEAQSELLSTVKDSGYRIVGKPLKSLPDGSMRGYLGVEMAVDTVLAAETCDIVAVVTGDPDFLPAVHAAQAKGARVEVIGCPGQTLDSIRDTSDFFTLLGNIFGSTGRNDDRKRSFDRPPPRTRGQERQEWPTQPPPPPDFASRREGVRRPSASKGFRALDGERLSGVSSGNEPSTQGQSSDAPESS